ncbi:cilia- and flagella-associated protein 206 [Colias croceus]|uniref:cilia- and flagella-associated protein 206 n=1 Tax=Colias crocea TaxID=72248 RepID=UPI001E27FC8C|nr:cilia- and flagella-associated protein 206 [Colias croceus]
MACNENVIKNIANEIARNCQAQNVTVDPEFVIYLIDLLLLNPKYGKLFARTISRNNLEFFVTECVSMLIKCETSINTLKMQYTMQSNYDKLQALIDKHLDSINSCLRPLVSEILDEDPDDEAAYKKLFRKMSIYIILASGLGNPGSIVTLKEGMSALESVFSLDDLRIFTSLPRNEKLVQLNYLMHVASGVRLFNRDCKKGGEGIPDLPFNLVDAGKACLASLSNSLIAVMQRVNSLTTAIADALCVHDETGNVLIDVPANGTITEKDYKQIFELLAFNRQYEVYIRKLLADVETMVLSGTQQVEKFRLVLEELHAAVKYKAAVPIVTVFPLFSRVWQVWRSMQNIMYLVSTVNKLMISLGLIQEQMKVPYSLVQSMLKGRTILSDQDRSSRVSVDERVSLGSLKNYVCADTLSAGREHVRFLGFCALCLTVGALVPSNMKMGLIKCKGERYGFCSVKMAARFSKDPQRYVNEVLQHARNNPHLINLLDVVGDVRAVRHVDTLVVRTQPKTKVCDKDIQTEAHPVEGYIEKNYTWDMWEWKRRACQWATIVNCQTHSTQTNYSHLRSEIQCQTFEARDKCQQTKKDCGINTIPNNVFLWGLRGQVGYGQHSMGLVEGCTEKKKAQVVSVCSWPCITSDDVTNVEE